MSRKCPACGSTQSNIIREIQMELPLEFHLPGRYNVVVCERCGMCYADTSAQLEDYDHYYRMHNSYSGNSSGIASTAVSCIEKFLEEEMGGNRSIRILDIGFGKGDLLLHLRQLGYTNLVGMDPSLFSVEHLKKLGIDVYQGSVYCPPAEMEELKGSVDVVLLTAVLEHLLEPKQAIKMISPYLKEGGCLVIDIPDYSFVHKIVLPIPNQFNQEHINYFSESSVRTLLVGTDFKVSNALTIQLKTVNQFENDWCKIFFCKKSEKNVDDGAEKDVDTIKSIENYFSQQEKRHRKTEEFIEKLYKERTPLIVWGTGAITMTLLAGTALSRCEIAAFVDGNHLKVGSEIAGRKIESPEVIREYPNAVILICVMMYAHEVKERIIDMGVKNEVIELYSGS